jgi:hypothetical protein
MTEDEFRAETIKIEKLKAKLSFWSLFGPLVLGIVALTGSYWANKINVLKAADQYEVALMHLLLSTKDEEREHLPQAFRVVYSADMHKPWVQKMLADLETYVAIRDPK